MNFKMELYHFWHLFFQQGGVINLLILGVAFGIVYILIGKLFDFYQFSHQMPSVDELKNLFDNGVVSPKLPESFLEGFSDSSAATTNRQFAINRYREVIIAETHRLESGLATMATWITAAPLLGLAGTVYGMIETFATITTYGIGNPALLSDGISIALITTETGLITAFPALLIHNLLMAKKNRLVHTLIQNGELALGTEGVSDAI